MVAGRLPGDDEYDLPFDMGDKPTAVEKSAKPEDEEDKEKEDKGTEKKISETTLEEDEEAGLWTPILKKWGLRLLRLLVIGLAIWLGYGLVRSVLTGFGDFSALFSSAINIWIAAVCCGIAYAVFIWLGIKVAIKFLRFLLGRPAP